MLLQIPVARLPHEWEAIAHDLRKAIKLSPEWTETEMLVAGLTGHLTFWRVAGAATGFTATQRLDHVLWVIFAGGRGSLMGFRTIMEEIERLAGQVGCHEVRFMGRDWRRVFPDFAVKRQDDGRWAFRKAI